MFASSRRFVGYNLIFLAFGALALLIMVVTSVLYSKRTQTYADDALRAARLDGLLLKYQADLVDAETALRGYQLTQRESYLHPYNKAVSEIEADAQAIRNNVQGFSQPLVTQAQVDELLRLGTVKIDIVRSNLEEAKSGRLDQPSLLDASDRGKASMDAVRVQVEGLQKTAEAVRVRQAENMRKAASTLTMLIALGVGMIVTLVIAATLFIVRHMSELAQARGALETAKLNLEERVRIRTEGVMRANEELQRYAYIVSHDLRAPLVNIMGFVSELDSATGVLKQHVETTGGDRADPAQAQVFEAVDVDIPEALGFIRSSMMRMDNLINEILKLSRAGRRVLEPEAIHTDDLVQTCIDAIRLRFDEANAEVEIEGAMPAIVSDRTALEQIFSNLLDNAAKYLVEGRPGRIVVRGKTKGGYAIFEIEDNGRGIAETDHERIFELFRRAGAQDRPGEGIGLAHTRALTRRLGGDVKVLSDGVNGATFRVMIARDLGALMRSEMS